MKICSVKKENFPYVYQFIQLAEDGRLQTPDGTAELLIDLLLSEEFRRILSLFLDQLRSIQGLVMIKLGFAPNFKMQRSTSL
ncbi:hypothetical protein [Bacillus atrophaeus]|uniref:hypothetical protein n=1 Tax=Bacillus atrophaeus TaxID=1452 RepID=UPI001EFC2BD3|nr:hypothetical protein [Bacillus atrophaeus]